KHGWQMATRSTSQIMHCCRRLWCVWRSASALTGARATSRPRCRNTSKGRQSGLMRRIPNESFADTIASREPTRRNRGHLTILDAMDDENLFAPHFENAASWVAWRAFLAVLFGYPLDEPQRELFRQCTGREHSNSEGHHEAWMVIGRRGGKSFALALIAV